MDVLKIGLLILIVLLPFIYIGWAAFQLKKEFPRISHVWNKLKSFDKYSIKVGLVLIIPVPALKSSQYQGEYLASLIIELLPAIATGFLVNGVIAYAKAMHKYNEENT